MKIKCQKCHEIFEANEKQSTKLNDVITKGKVKLVFIECPICLKDSYVDPFNLLDEQVQKKNLNVIIECPICDEGIVSYVDDGDEKFWGCGECGNVWFTKQELDKAISKAGK